MNSLDPWRLIVTDAYGDVVLPRPRYGHPFYTEVPGWIDYYGGSAGTTRQLFEGAFISGEVPLPTGRAAPSNARRSDLVAEVAPVVAPATGGIMVRSELDGKQVFHVEICVDGKCYRTSMNLAPGITLVMEKLARWHQGMHAPQPTPPTVVNTVQTAVGAAEDAIVGALVARHIDVASAGWLDDIKSGLTKVVNFTLKFDVLGVHNVASGLVKKLKVPITGAATAVATAYGGPLAGAAAAKLVGPIIDQTAEFGKKKHPVVAQAEEAAKTDPIAAKALKSAQDAVAQTIAAHHVQETAKKAATGDPVAQQKIVDVAQDVKKGDPAAKVVADLVANAMKSEWGAKLWEQATGRGPATVSPTTSGAWPWWSWGSPS